MPTIAIRLQNPTRGGEHVHENCSFRTTDFHGANDYQLGELARQRIVPYGLSLFIEGFMKFIQSAACIWILFAVFNSVGCCTLQPIGSCGPCGSVPCDWNSCSSGNCNGNPILRTGQYASCQGACGEVYVDEWVSEPPTPDNCGYACGGCGSCLQCQPVRNILRLLWGIPYTSSCDMGLCGSGCGTCGATSGCDCDGGQVMQLGHQTMSPSPNEHVETQPTPAPTITPTVARRLNPAQQHRHSYR
ncbi:MAG: hypothetical protein KDB03_10190 [Planctomycetales bacterium]|nr:hypothetical protein [Planctomycetales bacterium]